MSIAWMRCMKEGVGVVETGSERLVYSANPWDALGYPVPADAHFGLGQFAPVDEGS